MNGRIYCIKDIESTKDILVYRWNDVTAHKTDNFVQKATAMKAVLGSVKSVDWAKKEEKELKVMVEALKDLWEKSKEDVEVQIEEAYNMFEKTSNRIGKTESAITIVKNNKERQKTYAQTKKKE